MSVLKSYGRNDGLGADEAVRRWRIIFTLATPEKDLQSTTKISQTSYACTTPRPNQQVKSAVPLKHPISRRHERWFTSE